MLDAAGVEYEAVPASVDEAAIKVAFPEAEVLLHHDPFGLEAPERDPV